ncbi:MAG: sugar transferase [Kineosporiaceae bacterium]|nr:sugar transferase [Kineosporiaceae bacterium]
MGEDGASKQPWTTTAAPPSAPAPRAPGEHITTAPEPPAQRGDGAFEAKLRAVRGSDADAHDLVHFELAEAPAGAGRDPSEWVRRNRVVAPWLRPYTLTLVFLDLCLAVLGAVGGIAVVGDGEPYWTAVPFALTVVLIATLARTYEHRFTGAGNQEFERLAAALLVVLALSSTVAYAVQAQARGLVLAGSVITALAVQLAHAVARQVLYALRRRGRCKRKVVVVGLERSVDELIERLSRQPDGGVEVVAACIRNSSQPTVAGVPVAGTPDEARSVVRTHRAHAILITAWSEVGEEDLRRLSWEIEGSGIQLFVAPRLTEVAVPRMHLQTIGGVPLLSVEEPEFTGLRRVAKGALDYLIAITALILLSPIMIAVALAVRLDSRGPVFFRQERIGKDSRPFKMTKFRSMYVDAEERLAQIAHLNEQGGGPLFKMREDPRVTRVGAVLRKYSLDELPQLFDVLRRTMSVVGPRPPLAREVAAYEKHVHRRLLVKPGITGLWQVSGRSDLSWEESVRLDLGYVENWSLGLDLSIIARTVVAVLARRGAY